MEIVAPKTILSPKDVQALDPKERETYINNVMKGILKANRRGITVTQVIEATNFNRITVAKHLENLVSIREAYKRNVGNASVYYKNGKIVHETSLVNREMNGKIYSFYLLDNEEERERFIYIQEKEQDVFMNTKVNGGILINTKDLSDFMTELIKFANEGEMDGNEIA